MPRIDLQFSSNAPFTRTFIIEDANGAAADLTGSTFKLQVKARDANDAPTGSVLLTLTTGSGIAGTVASGEIEPTFPLYVVSPLAGLPPGDYVYDCLRLVSGVIVERVLWGLIDTDVGVTS